jgi:oligoribonuclease NrnB/cAMP/cGMP phosphodiesterase (DHH superfamily)
MKGLCIYHGNCADGFTAAWAVWKAKGDTFEYYPGVHDAPPPEVHGREVVIVDFSYPRPRMEQLVAQASRVLLLDHHQTAQEALQPMLDAGVIEGMIDLTRSGAMLAWNYFHPDQPPPQLLRHVQDRDIWQWALPGTQEILAGALSYPFTFEEWDRLMNMDPSVLYQEGVHIVRNRRRDMDQVLPLVTRRMRIGGHVVPVANLPPNMAAEGANRLAREAPFAAAYWDGPQVRTFSLRSRGGTVDVAKIAQQYGGGGHRNAAGFRLPYSRVAELEVEPDVD